MLRLDGRRIGRIVRLLCVIAALCLLLSASLTAIHLHHGCADGLACPVCLCLSRMDDILWLLAIAIASTLAGLSIVCGSARISSASFNRARRLTPVLQKVRMND